MKWLFTPRETPWLVMTVSASACMLMQEWYVAAITFSIVTSFIGGMLESYYARKP